MSTNMLQTFLTASGMPKEIIDQILEGEKLKRVEVKAEGTQLIIPKGMTKGAAIEELKRQLQQDEQVVEIAEKIDAFPLDGAHALMMALKDTFGWANLIPTPGFFGSSPPMMIGVETSPGVITQVPWGRMTIPNVEGYVETSVSYSDGRLIFSLEGKVKRKCAEDVKEIANLVRKYIKTKSIYKGKAISYGFAQVTRFTGNDAPKFIDTSAIKTDELILPKHVMAAVTANLLTPICKTKECKALGVPLKRGLLLAGKYGVGKTLAAYVTAKKAVENNWTFIYLTEVVNLPQALEFAKQYAPAVLFAEDIDRVTEGTNDEERDDQLNDIANTLDGIVSKNSEVFVVLTTNHPGRINKVMLRPGRIDCLIEVSAPDAEAAEKLARLYARGLLSPEEDLSEVSKKLAGLIPAVIREIVERSKLHAIARMKDGEPLKLVATDLEEAAVSMQPHLDLLNDVKEEEKKIEILASISGGKITKVIDVAQ